MCDDFFVQNDCTEFCDRRKTIVARDKGEKRKYIVINKAGSVFCKVRVDGCLITKGKKCDYLILNCDKNLAIFVELKGSDLLKAVEQIESSLNQLLKHLKIFTIYVRIVTSKVNAPDLRTTKLIHLRKRLKKINKDNIIKFNYLIIRNLEIQEIFE